MSFLLKRRFNYLDMVCIAACIALAHALDSGWWLLLVVPGLFGVTFLEFRFSILRVLK